MTAAEKEWYAANGHAHCPHGHEHPQERLLPDGRMVCGGCLVLDEVVTEVTGCVPGACGDRGEE